MYPLNAGKHTPSQVSALPCNADIVNIVWAGESSVSFITKNSTIYCTDIKVARKDSAGVSSMFKQYPDNQAQTGTFINAEHMHTDARTRTRA